MESGCEQILKITDRILDGGEITEEEAKALIRATDEDTMLLLACADKIRQKFSGRSVDLCAIVNARSRRCPLRYRYRRPGSEKSERLRRNSASHPPYPHGNRHRSLLLAWFPHTGTGIPAQ